MDIYWILHPTILFIIFKVIVKIFPLISIDSQFFTDNFLILDIYLLFYTLINKAQFFPHYLKL